MKKKFNYLIAFFVAFIALSINYSLNAQIQVGTGIVSQNYVPIYSCYGYSYTEQIYYQTEINASGNITSLSFYYISGTNSSSTDWTIYMGHSTKTSFATTTDWVTSAGLTQVYTGTVTYPAAGNWMTITLDTPFSYNNSDNLVIGVDENQSGYNCSINWQSSAAGTNTAIYYRSDGTNPNPASPPTASGRAGNRANVILGGLVASNPPNCNASPSSPAASATNVLESASINWNSATGSPSGYKIKIGTTTGGSQFLSQTDVGFVNTYQPSSNFQYNTTYYVTITPYNANGDATGCTEYSFTTRADPTVMAPWSDDVESHTATTNSTISYNNWSSNPKGTTSSFRWDIDASASTPSSSTGPSGANSGTKYFYTEASSGTTGSVAELSTPPINLSPLTTPLLKFAYHMYGSTMGSLNVDIYDGSSWTNGVYTLTGQQQTATSDPWIEASVNLSAYAGNTITVRFRGVRGSDYYGDMSLDDISVIEAPSCIKPSTLQTSNLTSSSADLAWTENNSATSWKIEYGTTGFTQGTGTIVTASSNPHTLTGLTSSTTYDWYIRADCGGGSDTSIWSNKNTFTTAFQCPVGAVCATYYAGDISTDKDFTSIPGTSTCPGSLYVVVPAGNRIDSVSSWYDMTAANGAWMSEQRSWLYSPSTLLGEPTINSGAGNGGTYSYSRDGLSFANGGTDTVNIEIHAGRTYGGSGCDASYNKVDNGSWTVVAYYSPIPSCVEPSGLLTSNITSSGADLSWTENNSSSQWQISYGLSGFTAGAGTQVNATSKPHSITGLAANTTYDWYVKTNCGGKGNVSAWSSLGSFTTLVAPVTVPYTQDFEGGSPLADFKTTIGSNAGLLINASSNCTGTNSLHMTGGTATGWSGGSGITGTTPTQAWVTNSTKISSAQLNVDATGVSSGLELSFDLKQTYSYGPGYSWSRILVNGTQISPDYQPTTGSADPCVSINLDLSAYAGTSFTLTFQSSMKYNAASSAPGDNAYFDNIMLQAVSCPTPASLLTSNLTNTSIDLAWTENGSATFWEISYGTTGFTAGLGTQDTTSLNPYSVSGLSANTNYDWYVRAICGPSDTSDWSIVNSFATLCNPYTTGYTQNFDGTTAPAIDACWTVLNAGNGRIVSDATPIGTTANSGANSIEFYNNTMTVPTNLLLVSPTLSDLDNTKRIKFYLYDYSNTSDFIVGTMSDPNNSATFTPFDTITEAEMADDVWELHTISFATYIGTDKYIAFAHGMNTTYDYILLDDFTYEDIPSCVDPSTLNTSNLTTTSVDLAWTENGSATSWEISYGASGFTAGLGTQIYTGSNPYSLSGLTAQTTYDWYVRAICGAGDTSAWSVVNSFTTLCNSISSFPYSENFDGSLTNNVWDCWQVINANSDSYTWSQASNYITPRSGSYTAHGMGNSNDHLISPQLNLPAGKNMRMKVWDVVESASRNNDYYILVSTNGFSISDFTDTLAFFSATSTTWNERTVDLSAYTGMSIYIDFWQTYSGATNYGFGLDDFLVEETPSCLTPTSLLTSNLTSTSVDLAWTENNTATSWKIEYGTSGFTQGTGTIVTTSSNPHSLSGLTAQTTYDWYVRSDCGGGSDTSTWSVVNSFYTGYCIPNPSSVDGTGITNVSFSSVNNTTSSEPGNYGDYSAMIGDVAQGLTIPVDITFKTGYTYETQIWIDWNNDLDFDDLGETVYTGTSTSANPTTLNASFTVGGAQALGQYRMRIGAGDNAVTSCYTGSYAAFEDYTINVIVPPSCLSPSALLTSNLASTSADLAWTENNSATSWIIEYGTSGFIQGTGTIVSTSSNPHSLSGLAAQTTYDWYVSADCGGGDTSAWSAVNSFTTLCAPVTLPYTEGFENAGAIPACWSQGSGNLEDWKFGSGSAASYGPTSGFGGSGYYAWIDDSSPNNTNTSMETPLIDLGAATNPGLEFYLWSENHGNSVSFLLHVAIDSGNGFNTVQTLDIENTGWEKQRIYLGDYIGKTIQIRFTGEEVGTGYQKDIAIDNVSIADGFVCESPINLRTQFSSDTSTTLRWDEIADAVGYKIRWKQAGAPNFGPVHFRQTNTPIYDIDGLTPSTNYVFVITANCKAGYGEPSAQRFSTLDAPCAIPTGMNIGGLSHNQARLAWDTMPGAKKYRVRYRVQGTTPWTMDVAYAGRTKLWLTGLNPATTYEWQVKTVCEYGTSSGTRWSGTQTFTTGLTPLRIKFSENKDVNEIELSIYPNPNNGSFNFELNNNGKVNGQIQVFDVVGKLVYQENIQSESGVVKKQIDLNVDAQGIYFLKFSNGDFIQNERIIIQ